jgi:hypothetical protein
MGEEVTSHHHPKECIQAIEMAKTGAIVGLLVSLDVCGRTDLNNRAAALAQLVRPPIFGNPPTAE